jgi:glutamate-1-semialdehyde 2,1-aminomutase
MTGVSPDRLRALLETETARFVESHPRSRELHARASRSLVGGVPMQWMVEWAGAFPVFAEEARGVRITDVDGHEYLDFCLGDTGSMFGHSPEPVAAAIAEQARRGITYMLPTEDSIRVAEILAERFGLPYWQIAMTATDANRFALRLARDLTGRPKILVFEGCYHGTVDETIATFRNGVVMSRDGNIGPQVDPHETTKVVEFNDLDALDGALAEGDVACVLAEPAMTNHAGIVLPEPGYHEGLREITRRHGSLLIIDETHTISSGPGGYTAAHGLQPDMLTMGKPLAGGIPVAAYGMSREVGEKVRQRTATPHCAVAGIGGTLTANAFAVHAMRANLEQVMTEENYARMIPLAERLAEGVRAAIAEHGLPWYVTQIGARVEYRFMPQAPRNGTEALEGVDHELDRLIHLWFLNRGILVTPFHNMLLISPETTAADVDRHNTVFEECAAALTGQGV